MKKSKHCQQRPQKQQHGKVTTRGDVGNAMGFVVSRFCWLKPIVVCHKAMTNQTKKALVLSCEVPGEAQIPTARYNARKLSEFFQEANVEDSGVFGGYLTFNHAIDAIKAFFSSECNVHIVYGIFHGQAGAWKLSDGQTLGLADILEQFYPARIKGTAKRLLIVSDACYSGCMVEEVKKLGLLDVAVQASCDHSGDTSDVRGETFTELLLWNLRGCDASSMDSDKERAILAFGRPCYYCPDRSIHRGWVFINEDGADQSSSQSISLTSETSETSSQRSISLQSPASMLQNGVTSNQSAVQSEDHHSVSSPSKAEMVTAKQVSIMCALGLVTVLILYLSMRQAGAASDNMVAGQYWPTNKDSPGHFGDVYHGKRTWFRSHIETFESARDESWTQSERAGRDFSVDPSLTCAWSGSVAGGLAFFLANSMAGPWAGSLAGLLVGFWRADECLTSAGKVFL